MEILLIKMLRITRFEHNYYLLQYYLNYYRQRAIKDTLVMHTCGICDREFGLKDCRLLSDLKWEIENSDLGVKFMCMLEPLREPNKHDKYQVEFNFLF